MPTNNKSPLSSNKQRKDSANVQFMVDFTLPKTLNDDFICAIPRQRSTVSRYFADGKLLNYALSLENSKLWAIFSVPTEADLMELISEMPLTRFMTVHISELTFYNNANPVVAAFSVN